MMSLAKKLLWVLISVLPVTALAQLTIEPCETSGKICNPLKNATSLTALIQNVLVKVLQIGIPIVALAIIYSGFLFVFARGNEENLTKAKSALLYSIIGAAILLGSWAIAELIQNTVVGLQ